MEPDFSVPLAAARLGSGSADLQVSAAEARRCWSKTSENPLKTRWIRSPGDRVVPGQQTGPISAPWKHRCGRAGLPGREAAAAG